MYQYLFDDKTTQKINDSTKKSKSILEQFEEVDKKYVNGNKVESELNLERLEYKKPTQEEVKSQAENSLKSYKDKSIEAINSNYSKQNDQIDQDIQDLTDETNTKQQEIKSLYSQVKDEAQNDAIKRGLARSSIIVNKLENYDNKMLNDLAVLSSQSSNKLTSLNTQKNTLELEKANALKSFDIEYAVKLQDKINSINEDIDNAEQSVTKYNNEIAQLEAKWNKEIEQENYNRNQDLAEYIAKYGTYNVETLKRDEKYQLAREYFKNMDKDMAISELTYNSTFKDNLGAGYYDKLLKEINER